MTSGNGRAAKTLQERFGFLDPELSTPAHDEIVLWLDANMDKIAQRIFPSWSPAQIREAQSLGATELPPYELPNVTSKRWEAPVLSGTFTVGFVDMLCDVQRSDLWQVCTWSSVHHPACDKCAIRVGWQTERLAFEVKTVIPSVGELVRQIRLYQTYLKNTKFYVVAPDARWADVLRGQGIGFIKSEAPA